MSVALRKMARSLFVFAVVAVAVGQLWAQNDKGRLAGTVKDPSGAVVVNAKVTLTSVETGVSQETVSTSTGTYFFPNVSVGHYKLTVDMPGFKGYEQTGIEIHTQVAATADVELVVGNAKADKVEVTAAAPLLQTEQANVGTTIGTVAINDLPLNGRNMVMLALLQPGTYNTNGLSSWNPGIRGGGIIQNGNEAGQVDYRVNGQNNNLEVFGGITISPVPDAVQEFKLESGNPSAEYGHSSGAIMNTTLKSGTNQFHGNLFYYMRNEFLNANDWATNFAGQTRKKYRLDQEGGTFGGPVFPFKKDKNKTFVFLDFQRSQTNLNNSWTRTVPTNVMQDSNFTNMSDMISMIGKTKVTDPLGRSYYPGTIFDPATTRYVTKSQVDAITGLVPTKTGFVRDPFFTGGSVAGITDFTLPAGAARTATAVPVSMLNQLPANRIDPNALKILKLFPRPNLASQIAAVKGSNYWVADPLLRNVHQYDVRIDHSTAKDTIFGSFSRNTEDVGESTPFPVPLSSYLDYGIPSINPTYVIAISDTHVFSPTLINEARFGYNHNYNYRYNSTDNTHGIPEQYGINGVQWHEGNGGLPSIEWNLFNNIGSRRYLPTVQTVGSMDFADNLTKIYRNHEFKTGFQLSRIYGDILQPANPTGYYQFTGRYSDNPDNVQGANAVADFLLTPSQAPLLTNDTNNPLGVGQLVTYGGPSNYAISNWSGSKYHAPYYGAYFQDNWKVTPKLTLNLGLRWDYFSPYNDPTGRQGNFVMDNPAGQNPVSVGGIVPAVPGQVTPSGTLYLAHDGCSTPFAPNVMSMFQEYNIKIKCMPDNTVWRNHMDNFAPRVGVNYRLNDKWVLRAGYGISYGALPSVGYGGTTGNIYPFQYTVTPAAGTSVKPITLPNGAPATLENTFTQVNVQDPTQLGTSIPSFAGHQYSYPIAYTQNINLTTQYQFTSKDSFQVGYVSSLGRHLVEWRNQNSINVLLPKNTDTTKYIPMPKLSANMNIEMADGSSYYHSLQTSYQHRFSQGLSVMANYTYGLCKTDDQTGNGLGVGWRGQYLPGFGPHADYTYCSQDVRHVFHMMGQFALPFGKGKKLFGNAGSVADAVIGGWQLNWIYAYMSGQVFSVGCLAGTSSGSGCTAVLKQGEDPYAGGGTQTQWLNPNAFIQPPDVTSIAQADYGPLGGLSNLLRGPTWANTDISLFKHFKTSERTNLEFRAEFFNVFNNVSWNNPGNLNWTTTGQIGTRNGFSWIGGTKNAPRVGQLALKFYF